VWVYVLLDKYASYRPTVRLLAQLQQHGLSLPLGTVTDGLQGLEPMLRPIYEAILPRNREGTSPQADETRWRVFMLQEGKTGYRWWLWVVVGPDTIPHRLDPSRGQEVPEGHFPRQTQGVLEVDRSAGYEAMAQVKPGLWVRAFCGAHVPGDFVQVGKGWAELLPWALEWVARIRQAYRLNRERLRHPLGSAEFQHQDGLLREAVGAMQKQAATQRSDPRLRPPCCRVLESLAAHWTGLTRFVDDPRIPRDNHQAEPAARGPAAVFLAFCT
jgi:transposase